MDDLSRAVDEALMSDLECPVCMEYMVPPIKLCMNGHSICSKCKESIQCCHTCRATFTEIRNVALKNIARSQKYPCANRQSGCLELFSIEQIGKHHAACVYGKLKCPLHLLKKCSWNGLKNDLKEHVKAAHNECFYIVSTFRSDLYEDRICLITQFRELFGQYKRIQDGRFYSAVQLIGTSSQASKYKCKFTLRAENGIEHIINTFLVQGYSEDLETIFNSGKCLCLDEAVVRNFMVRKWVKLHIELSKVE